MNAATCTRNAALGLAVAFGGSFLAFAAQATPLLTFGQISGANTVVATESAGPNAVTTITNTNTAVNITQIDGGSATTGYLNLSLSSTNAATTISGFITETFSGSFFITSGLNDTGTNYLSGTLTDVAFGQNTSFTLSASTPPSGAVTFTSTVIPNADLGLPRGASLSFANVIPGLSIVNNSIAPFGSTISGTFSGNAPTPVPEPASLAVLGIGLLGLGMVARRRA